MPRWPAYVNEECGQKFVTRQANFDLKALLPHAALDSMQLGNFKTK